MVCEIQNVCSELFTKLGGVSAETKEPTEIGRPGNAYYLSNTWPCADVIRYTSPWCLFGGPSEIRTHGLFSAIEARSQLRYRPVLNPLSFNILHHIVKICQGVFRIRYNSVNSLWYCFREWAWEMSRLRHDEHQFVMMYVRRIPVYERGVTMNERGTEISGY